MTDNYVKIRLSAFLLCALVMAGCTQLRTEFYRNETGHLYEVGCAHYKQGEYDAARTVLEDLVRLDPDYGPAYAVLGNLAMIDEQYEQAHDYYQQAIDHDPELEKDILPFLLISSMHKIRKPLTDSGIDLAVIYPLMMEEKIRKIETLLEQDVPLDLLARDSVSITPGQLGELRAKAAELAPSMDGYEHLQLFTAYLLFYGSGNESIIEKLLLTIPLTAAGEETQAAALLMGRVQEKQGQYVAAVKWYLAAVKAGAAIEDVAHYLAKIYQVDFETILPSKTEVQLETDNASAGKVALPASPVRAPQKRAALSVDDGTDFVLPKPRAVLITTPQ